MLEQLTLTNFQTHKKLVLNLDKRITTIIGPSDAGKSAILRALYWLGFNRPAGSAFQKHEEPFVRVTLDLDGRRVVRRRGRKGNAYAIDGKTLKAFGSDVPDEVKALLRFGEENFQLQMDPPFWLSSTPGEVSRALNYIVNLESIDKALSNIAATVRNAKAELSVCESRLATAKQDMKQHRWAAKAYQQIRRIHFKEHAHNKAGTEIDKLEELVQQAIQLGKKAKSSPDFAPLRKAKRQLDEEQKKTTTLEHLIGLYEIRREEECNAQNRRAKIQARLDKQLKRKCPACGRPTTNSAT